MYRLGEKNVISWGQIFNLYTKGAKLPCDYTIGIEYERIPLSDSSMHALDYWGDGGVKDILEKFARLEGWDNILDGDNVIGIQKGHDTITLEPGAQVELSIKPEKNIFRLKDKIENLDKNLKPIFEAHNAKLLNYGVSPYSTCKTIRLIPKKRYKVMASYLWGILSDVMMRETAGIQCCIDFKSEDDAMRKYKLANKLSPFMTAMFANSPIRGGVDTGYKSFRALSWINTDNDRCGFFGKISEKFSFEEYIDCVMKTPIIFIQRDGYPIKVNGDITFEEFMKNGYEGISPTIEDYELQANLCFPEVRMRNFIEIRNHDCVGGDLKYALLALYKGIMYDDCSMDECEDLLKDLQYKDFSELRYNVPKLALQAQIKNNHTVKDYAKELINIAQKSLKEAQTGEELFLDSIKEYTLKGLCPADVIVKKWNGSWNKNLNKLINYLEEFEN